MSPSDNANPERRSNAAMLLFCIGAGLCALAWFLGMGAVMSMAVSGGEPSVVIAAAFGALGVMLLGVLGFILVLVGGVWMIAQVIADQSGGTEEARYRDVER